MLAHDENITYIHETFVFKMEQASSDSKMGKSVIKNNGVMKSGSIVKLFKK